MPIDPRDLASALQSAVTDAVIIAERITNVDSATVKIGVTGPGGSYEIPGDPQAVKDKLGADLTAKVAEALAVWADLDEALREM